jgi:hypothetical protein
MTIIRKFMNLVELGATDPTRAVDRDEAGRVLHPDVSYDVSADKVVATLKSYNSQIYTKLAQKIERVTALEAEATKLREEVQQMGRDQIADLFAADDAVRTRVIDTVSFVMKITKDPKAAETVKYAKVITELGEHLTPELLTVMEGLVKKYTTLQKAKPAALSYEPKAQTESEELSEGILDSIKAVLAKFKSAIMSWGQSYDSKLDALKAEVAVSESEEVMEANAPMAFSRGDTVYSGSKKGKVVDFVEGKPESTIIELENGERDVVATKSLTLEKPSFMSRMASKIVGESELDEVSLRDMSSGASKDRDAIDSVSRVRGGHQTVTIGGIEYKASGSVKSTTLKVGDKFLNSYNSYNQGADAYELVGFNTNGGDDVEFTSLKEVSASVGGAKNLKELSDKADNVSMIVKDLEDGSQGAYLYLSQGRWCRGSGAERVTFTRLESMTTESEELEEYDQYNHVGKDFQVTRPVGQSRPGQHSARQQAAIERGTDAYDFLPKNQMVSKWRAITGDYAYVWRDYVGSDTGVVIDNKGVVLSLPNMPKDIEGIHDLLANKYKFTRVATEAAQVEAVDAVEEEEPGLTEYAEPEDAYPVVGTLTDWELTNFVRQWKYANTGVDPDSDSGRAFNAFGDELRQECQARGLTC